MAAYVDWSGHNKRLVIDAVDEWFREHGTPCAETAHQDDECIIDSIDLVGKIADIIVKYNEEES